MFPPRHGTARRRVGRLFVIAALLATALEPVPLRAQIRGSHLPLNHPAHPIAELLAARGALSGLDSQMRPFLLRELREAVRRAREQSPTSGSVEARLLDLLDETLGSSAPAEAWVVSLAPELGVVGATSVVPDLLLPAGDSAVADLIRVRFGAEYGPVSAQFEPERMDGGRRAAFPAALAGIWFPWGSLSWGELERNWGPPGVTGLLIAPLAGTRPELAFSLGPPELRFEYRMAPLSDGVSSDTGETVGRTWAVHRLRWLLSRTLELALWETVLAAEPGGADRARFSPIVPFSFPSQRGIDDDRNITVGLDMAWRVHPRLQLETQLLLDDLVVRRDGDPSEDNPYPHRYGYTVQLRGPVGAGGAWRAYVTALSSLALNTFDPEEAFLDAGRGLGRLRPDHRQAGAFVTLPLGFHGPDRRGGWPGGAIVELGVEWRRQGIRAFTDPFPDLTGTPPGSYPSFSVEVEREVRALVSSVSWTAEAFALRGEGHVQRRHFPVSGDPAEWGFEGSLELVWRVGRWHGSGAGR